MTRPLASVDPLQRAREAAAQALRDRLLAAGWPTRTATATAELFAEVAINAAYVELKRALRPRTEDGR